MNFILANKKTLFSELGFGLKEACGTYSIVSPFWGAIGPNNDSIASPFRGHRAQQWYQNPEAPTNNT